MYVCLRVCAHVFITIHLSMCVRVCMCIYVYIYGEEDRCSVVKEKPFVTYLHGHIRSFTQLFLNWHSFEMASSSCDTICKCGHSAHLQYIPVEFLENGLLVYIC